MSWNRTNVPGYVKNSQDGTIINTNMGEFQSVKAARRRKLEVEAMREHIARLEKLVEGALKKDGS
jgi:acylphosphatase